MFNFLSFKKLKKLRSIIYDWLVTSMTIIWYREVLLQCPMDVSILDVGIGTATSLIANRDIIRSKRINVIGIDYDSDYVLTAQENINKYELNDQISIIHCSILDYMSSTFDIIYFSGSFMIMPKKVDVLKHCSRMLNKSVTNGSSSVKDDENKGLFFFTQTFEKPTFLGLYLIPLVKYLLKILTTIDFGKVTYEKEFMLVLKEADVKVVSVKSIRESYFRKEVIVIAAPEN